MVPPSLQPTLTGIRCTRRKRGHEQDGLLVVATPAYQTCLPIGPTWTDQAGTQADARYAQRSCLGQSVPSRSVGASWRSLAESKWRRRVLAGDESTEPSVWQQRSPQLGRASGR